MATPEIRTKNMPPPTEWRDAWDNLDRVEQAIKRLRHQRGASEAMGLVLRLRACMTAMLKE